jgi:hypothetical protein
MRSSTPITLMIVLATAVAAAEPAPTRLAAIGYHLQVGPMGPVGGDTLFLVHVSPDRRSALALTAAHCDPRAGDPVAFPSVEAGEVRGSVSRVIAQSTRLDYSLLSIRLDEPIAARPIPAVGDHLPTAGKVASFGWVPGAYGMRLRSDRNEMRLRPGISRVRYPESPYRGIRDAVPAGLLNPFLMFTPLAGMPVKIGFAQPPDVRRVTVAAFQLDGGPGMSGGPILDGEGRAVAHISGGDYHGTAGVPTALVVRDVARRLGGLYGEPRAMVRDWLSTVRYRVRGGRPLK